MTAAPTSTARSARRHRGRRLAGLLAVAAAGTLLGTASLHAAAARRQLVLVQSDFRLARAAVISRSAEEAETAIRRAEDRLASARGSTAGFPLNLTRPLPVLGSPARAIRAAADAGLHSAAAARVLVDVSSNFPTRAPVSAGASDLQQVHDAAQRSADSSREAASRLDAAVTILGGPSGAVLPFVRAPARSLRAGILAERNQLERAARGLDLLADVTGPTADLRLLVLAQDSLELRPTGGYIGSYGVLRFTAGSMVLERYDATEALPPAEPPAEPPVDLAPFLPGPWALSNVNWWPDFPTTAEAAADMFRRQGGGEVQGVLALTDQAIAALVGAVGPLPVPGYAKPVTEEDFAERVVYEVELKHPPDVPRKRFLIELSHALFDRLAHLRPEQVPQIGRALERATGRGDIQLWFADEWRQSLLEGTVVEGRLPAATGDFLLLTEANISASKANVGLVRRADYAVSRQRDGSVRAHLRIEFHNRAPASAVNPRYIGYLRIFVPAAAEVPHAPSGQRPELTADGRHRVLSAMVAVRPLDHQVVTFDYILPPAIAPGGRYDLTWLRQAGTHGDSFQVVVNGRAVDQHGDGRILRVRKDFDGTGLVDRLRHQARTLLHLPG